MDMYQKRKMRKENKNSIIETQGGLHKTVLSWYPGHMAKTRREINDIMPSIDIILELLDSRIPKSSHIEDLDKYTKVKKVVLVFNKYDLCDKNETNKWKKYYENKGFIVVCINSKDGNDYKKLIDVINNLMDEKNKIRFDKGLLPKKAKCLVVGVPNVGKSTLINKIAGKKVVDTANKPGVTKKLNIIRLSKYADLVDTPGILWPKLESNDIAYNLASMSIIKEEIVPITDVGLHILNKLNFYPGILKKEYNIENFDYNDIDTSYETICKFKNIPIKEDIDYERVSLLILNMLKQEKIKDITFDHLD